MGSLFGGGGGTERVTSTQTTVQELSPEQKRLLGLVIPEAEKFVQDPPELFLGSAIQPFDPLQLQAQEDVLALAAPGGQLSGLTSDVVSANQFLLGDVLFPESNPALQASIEAAIRPLEQSFENVTLPGIRGEAITAGGFGGSRQGIAEGLAAQGLTQEIADISAELTSEAFQAGLDALTKSLFAAPATAGLSFLPSTAVEAVGIQRQGFDQALLTEEADRFIAEQLLPFAAAQDVAALAFGIPGGSATTTASSTGPGAATSSLQNIFGLGSLGLAIGGPIGGGIGGLLGLFL